MGMFDDYWNWGTQVGSDVFGGIYDAFNDPRLQAQRDLASNPYIPGYSPIKEYGEATISGLGNLFDLINRPVNIATAAASGLPYTDPSFEIPSKGDLAGGSLRDLAAEGHFRRALLKDWNTPLEEQKITNPYLLQLIESIGGEALDELSDPTNIPGALVGAAGLAGKTASGLDKLISAGGAISGFGEGLPGLASAGKSIWEEGLNPENFGQGLESLIAAGFGGLSAAGLNAESPRPEVPVMTDSQVYDLIRITPDIQRSPEESMLDEKIMESLMRQEMGLPSVPYLESLTAAEEAPFISQSERTNTGIESALQLLNQPIENIQIPYDGPEINIPIDDSALYNRIARGKEGQIEVNNLIDQGLSEQDAILREATKDITIDISPEDVNVIAEPITPKEELNSFVSELKSRYGDSWRKKMTTDENIEFRDKQLEVQSESSAKTENYDAENKAKMDELISIINKPLPDAFPIVNEPPVPEGFKRLYRGQNATSKWFNDSPKGRFFTTEKALAQMYTKGNNLLYVDVPIDYKGETLNNKLGDLIQNLEPGEHLVSKELANSAKQLEFNRNVPPKVPPSNVLPSTTNVEKPESPSKKLQSLSIAERAALPTLRNLSKASPEIGSAVKSYDSYHTELASENIADVRQSIKGVNKAGEQKIIRFLDGEDIKLDQHESKVARELRRTLDNIANLAGQNDVLVGYRQGYFPRKYEDRFEWDISPRAFDSKNKPVGALEKSREGNRSNFRRDFKVLEEYINEATRRISEAKYLGKSLENVTGKKFSGDRPTVEYLEKAIGKITGREGSSTPARFADRLRKITALGDLGLAAIYQPAQFAHTASAVGLRRATRAAFKAIMNGGNEVQNATRSGALWPVISHEVSRAIGDKGYMHLIPTMDKMMRVHANVAGRLLAQDALKGNAYAKRQIKDLGIELHDPKLFDKVGKAITDKTQFRTGTLDLPLWTHSPLGKLAFQYSSFAYAQAKFAHDMLKHPVKNFGQIVRFAAMGALLGEGAADLREMLRSIIPGKDEEDDIIRRMMEAAIGDESFDEKPWLKKLQAVTRSKRIPTSSPAWRAVQNLSMAGGVGIFQNVAEKATSGQFWQLPLGPAGSMLVDTGEAARTDLQKGIQKGDWSFDKSLRNLIQNVPLPLLSNRKLADVVVPKKSKKKAKDPFDFDIDFKDVKFDF